MPGMQDLQAPGGLSTHLESYPLQLGTEFCQRLGSVRIIKESRIFIPRPAQTVSNQRTINSTNEIADHLLMQKFEKLLCKTLCKNAARGIPQDGLVSFPDCFFINSTICNLNANALRKFRSQYLRSDSKLSLLYIIQL